MTDTNTKNILLIGRTGSGKSTLANVLLNKNNNFEEVFKESNSSISETQEIQIEEANIEGTNYRIIDTIGIGNTKLSDEKMVFKIFKSCRDFKDGFFQILFIIDGRFTQEEIKFYNIIRKKILDENVTKYTTIVRTKFFNFRNREKCDRDRELLGKENRKISKLVNLCERRVIYVDNPSLSSSDYDSEELFLHRKRRGDCRDILIKYLENCKQENFYKPKNLESISEIVLSDEKILEGKIEELKNKGFFKKKKEKLERRFKKPETGEEVNNFLMEAVIEVNKVCKQM